MPSVIWFFIAVGAVVGFVYEFGMTWYVTWSPQAQARHGQPMLGPDSLIIYGLIGAFCGGVLAAAIGTGYLKLRQRHIINTAELMRQIKEAESKEGQDRVWPPPPRQ